MKTPTRPLSWASAYVTLVGRGSGALNVLSGLALAAMMILVALDVTLRNTMGTALTGSVEYTSQWMMPLIVLFALAYTEKSGEHIRVTIVEDGLRGKSQLILALFGQICTFALALVLAVTSWGVAADSIAIGETVPMGTGALIIWPIKALIVLAWIWFAAQAFANVLLRLLPSISTAERDSLPGTRLEKVESDGIS
ncbi:TRAP transporter small permease subunit [Arthrobacter sp. NPDC089319]|uniref:TRAP transporter small permease subunit n=1 Tax=Arthrobacter sp. NPDC089319 TaxID=3155915 RepID=UPI00343FE91C